MSAAAVRQQRDPPAGLIPPSPRVLERMMDRDTDLEAAD